MIRSVVIRPDMMRVNVIAAREGVTPTVILRGLIVQGITAYQAEHGTLSIDGVSPYASTTLKRRAAASAEDDHTAAA